VTLSSLKSQGHRKTTLTVANRSKVTMTTSSTTGAKTITSIEPTQATLSDPVEQVPSTWASQHSWPRRNGRSKYDLSN